MAPAASASDAAGAFAAQHRLSDASLEALASESLVLQEIAAGVERGNSHLSRVEQIKKFTIVSGDWLPGGDELTPTMKLKRKFVNEKYRGMIDGMYAEAG